MNAAALFIWEKILLSDAAVLATFDEKFKLVADIGGLALKALNLEPAHVVAR
jgi:hypothetical protein